MFIMNLIVNMVAVIVLLSRQLSQRENTFFELKPPTREINVLSEDNIVAVARSGQNKKLSWNVDSLSIRESTRRTMYLDLGLHPYKLVLTQELKPNHTREELEANIRLAIA